MLRSVVVAALLSAATAAWADAIEDKAEVCGACHGEKGLPAEPAIPIIWGQNEGYLYLELRDFQKGARKDDQHDADRSKPLQGGRAGARRIFCRQAMAEDRRAERLQGGRGDRDDGDQVGRLHKLSSASSFRAIRPFRGSRGRSHDYLAKTMMDFRTRARANNPGMSDLMNTVTPEQLTAMAAYLAGL